MSNFVVRSIYRGSRRIGQDKMFTSIEEGKKETERYLRRKGLCRITPSWESHESTLPNRKRDVLAHVENLVIKIEEIKE